MTRSWRALAALPLALASALAAACPICIGAVARSPAQQLADAPRVVLAAPEGKRYRVLALVKGERPEAVLDNVAVRDPGDAGRGVLLVRDEYWPVWASLGAMDARHAATLRRLAEPRPLETDAGAWRTRIGAALPHLHSREPLLAEIAYGASASAPYAAMRAARAEVDLGKLRRALADPRLASRRSLYILLLGVAGDARDAEAIESQLEAAWQAREATDLAALLAAVLELRGPSQVAWIEDRYFRDASRTPAELQAALLALSVHGNAPGAIARERVIAAYVVFMREHKPIAGLVAQDLAAWQYWGATEEFAALLKSDVRQQYASRIAILAYLRQSLLAAKPE